MAGNGPDPGEFFDRAQRMLRELFGDTGRDDDVWAETTRRPRAGTAHHGHLELSPQQQRENLTFALATRAVEALEDLALNVAAIRQRLERSDPQDRGPRSADQGRDPDEGGAST